MVSSFSRKTLLSRVIVFFLVTFFLWLSVFNYTINTNDHLQDEIINEFLHDHQQGSEVAAAARKIISEFKSKHKMLNPNLRNDTTIQLGLMYDVLAESEETTTTTVSSLGLLQELVQLAESDISTTSTQSSGMNFRKLVETNVNRLRRERIRNVPNLKIY